VTWNGNLVDRYSLAGSRAAISQNFLKCLKLMLLAVLPALSQA